MKMRHFIILILMMAYQMGSACDACKKLQPKITQGITHGTGPESNWDWVIVSVIASITLLTLLFSLKYLINPGEKNEEHIKKVILRN